MGESSSGSPYIEDNKVSLLSHFKENSKDNKILKNYFRPICSYLISRGIEFEDLQDFIGLLKSYSMKDSKQCNQDSIKMLNKKDFTKIFKFLFKKTKDEHYILQRTLYRMNSNHSNMLFAYFSLKYKNEMEEIANKHFDDFEFKDQFNKKGELSTKWNNYVEHYVKKCRIDPVIPHDILSDDSTVNVVEYHQEKPIVDFAYNLITNPNDDDENWPPDFE